MLRTEWRVLFHLGIYGEMTAKEIGQRAKLHKTKISRAVQKLVDRRFLTRKPDEQDRRAEQLALTPAGQAAYLDLRKIASDYDASLIAGLTEDEVTVLKRALGKLAGY
jgi:DNA-binding MarR family transcriptional regulator